MKKSLFIPMIAFMFLIASAFNYVESEQPQVTIKPENVTLKWTAYKMTEKMPVEGTFKEINIEGLPTGSTVVEALDGLKFSIPISSIFSLSTLRDNKIKNFFFGKMIETASLRGTIEMTGENKGSLLLTMNGVAKKLPINCSEKDGLFHLEALMDVNNWGAQKALESLNDACEDLHSGPDGESITWSEVKIEATISFDK